jgi:hypothetical protein
LFTFNHTNRGELKLEPLEKDEKVPELTEQEKTQSMCLKGRYDFCYGKCLGKLPQAYYDAMMKGMKGFSF